MTSIAPVAWACAGVKWQVRSAGVLAASAPLLQQPDSCFVGDVSLLRDTTYVTMGRVPVAFSGGERWLLRRTNYTKPKARLRDTFRVSGPMRAFTRGLEFERVGLPTPRVLAAGIRRAWQKPVKGYLLVEEIHTATTLVEYLRTHGQVPGRTIANVARAIVQMHEAGFTHGDLTINNVLLDASLQPWFIDLERARARPRAVNWREAVEDFFRFARHVDTLGPAARFAALRLVRHYCAGRRWRGREREFATAVLARLHAKLKDNA